MMFDLFLFNCILFLIHQFSISFIALVKAGLQSAIIAISSANTNTNTPNISLNLIIKSLITTLKKKGDVLFP